MLKLSLRRKAPKNLISLTNNLNKAEGLEHAESRAKGVPRIDRQDAKKITMLHDSEDLFIAGRNRCTNFGNNQFFLGSKKAKEGMLVGASDDWPDDWMNFSLEMQVRIASCFLTHCHVDDIVNLPTFWEMIPDLKVHWCPAEGHWVEQFRNSCVRYGRPESAKATLPMFSMALPNNNLLSCDTNRSSSFIEIGEIPCYYIHTPGHSPGHMMLHLPLQRFLFTGDLIYRDSVGRVDLPFGSADSMAQSLRAVEDMPDSTVLLPSHGKITTLGRERRRNPALRRLYEMLAVGKHTPKIGTNSGFL